MARAAWDCLRFRYRQRQKLDPPDRNVYELRWESDDDLPTIR